MKCEDVDKLMIDYLDRTLDSNTAEEIDKHLAVCERCLDDMKDTKEMLSGFAGAPAVKPDDSLRINFYHMLHSEINKTAHAMSKEDAPVKKISFNRQWISIAAGIALFAAGSFIGIFVNSGISNSKNNNEISQLHTEVSDLKKAAMFTMLQQESSSDRIQAVRYADDLQSPDQNVIDVLLKTLNTDRNVNVRMAAAYALSKYADQKVVCDSLVQSLTSQTDPIMQVTLINLLAERKVKTAMVPIQRIISNKKTIKEVRNVAENSLHAFI